MAWAYLSNYQPRPIRDFVSIFLSKYLTHVTMNKTKHHRTKFAICCVLLMTCMIDLILAFLMMPS